MKSKRKIFFTLLLSIFYSCCCIIGNSFLFSNSFKIISHYPLLNIIAFTLLIVIFYYVNNFLFDYLNNYKIKNTKTKKLKLVSTLKKHPYLYSFLFILICWLPVIISFYPAILSPDPSFQIKQFFGIPNKYSTYSVLLNPNVIITNHHPVLHTMILGTSIKIGLTLFNSTNIGLFIYSILQILVLSSTLSYTIYYLNNKISDKWIIFMLLVYSFVPVFPFYAMSCVKDVFFGSLIILYIIYIYSLINKDDLNTFDFIKLTLLLILIFLFRNNGIHTIVFSFPFLLFLNKNKMFKLKILSILILVLGVYYSYNDILLPYLNITPTSVREKLSIPFQQTARYVKKHKNEISEEDKKAIDIVLGFDDIDIRYKEEISDPVKNGFNRYATNDDLKNYFVAWYHGFTKDPITYFEATINNTYGYYYPLKTNWYIYYKYDTRIVKDGFDYHYNKLETPRKVLSYYALGFPYIPILGLIVNIGFNVWVLVFMFVYLLYQKKYRYITYLLPSCILLLVCLASPVNVYFRYALPFVFGSLLNVGLFLISINGK